MSWIQQPVVASGEPPALQCRTPSRHHLELQDRRDYTPADRAARTCWPLPPRPHLTSPKVLKSSKPRSKCQFSQGAVRCVIIPIVKTHQTQLHSTQSWKKEKITRAPRERETRTHLKKVSPLRGSRKWSLCAAKQFHSDASLEAVDRRAPNNSKNWPWTTEGDVSARRSTLAPEGVE
ncbi:hypothetical protein TNCV_2228321 [Trichonephila clavipes]|nr:hypothetical protein TNCV_2228321 [Trichonephila clavipes]